MMVTSIDKNGTIYLSAHNNDQINTSIIDLGRDLFIDHDKKQIIYILRMK